jgi:tRNA pseudouridine55 synthase
MDAFFFIDKPTGITSFQVLREMRRILWVKKIGHSGTLDPLATGWLLVATGNYTKLIPYVEKDSKSYLATIRLDGVSASYDSDTPVTFLSPERQRYFIETLTLEEISHIFQTHFFGKIQQIPPKYSALKIDGKRALDRVLAGEEIEMKMRDAEVLSYDIKHFNYPELVVEISVSAGTYIRSITHDLGQVLWTGGYLTALRRTQVWHLDIIDAVTLEALSRESIFDIQKIFPDRVYKFSDERVYTRLQNGQRVVGDFPFPESRDIFLSQDEEIRYIVEYKEGVLHPRKKVV